MRIKAYTLDSLRKIIRELQKENKELRKLLKINNDFGGEIDKNKSDHEYDEDQENRIVSRYISLEMVNDFYKLFWGRQDVYAKRGTKGGYYPQCDNRWSNSVCPKQKGEKQNCSDCKNRKWTKLSIETVLKHLLGNKQDGSDVIGVYPLFPDGTCRFIVFDFDNHEKGAEKSDYANIDNEWKDEVDALRQICIDNGIEPLVERSRSGRGAHIWILFSKPIKAETARKFGSLLLDKGALSVNIKSFNYYDRMYPTQDYSDGIGNLIALPMQGQALRNGNSAFVDENWNAYPDQWEVIYKKAKRLEPETINNFIDQWLSELGKGIEDNIDLRPKPWERNLAFSKDDVDGKMHIVLSDGIYVDCLNLSTRIQNQIRALAAFSNPIYYKNIRLGLSNYYNYSSVYLGKDVDGYIKLPRGLKDKLVDKCKNSFIEYEIENKREYGRPIRVSFSGDLRIQQDLAAKSLLSYDDGILNAATAFGKTVVCSYLISQKKINTLVLVPKKELLKQWKEELTNFLTIDEDPPQYKTKAGKTRLRKNVVGELSGSKNTLTGIIDVAMVSSIYGKNKEYKLTNSYGMVIVDECHHAASSTNIEVLENIKSKYLYGVSATLKRSDNLDPITLMMIGPVRHRFTAMDRAKEQGIEHFVYPRYTRTVNSEFTKDINKAYSIVSNDIDRSYMIVTDVKECVSKKRTPLILTRLKEQAKFFYNQLKLEADNVFIMYGDNTEKENEEIRNSLKTIPTDETVILVATGQKIGEGFNYPRLDTLMLASPVSDGSLLEQYVGRLNRDYTGKENVIVYDYIDHNIRVFDNMYNKRLKTYKRIGFNVVTSLTLKKQKVNAIFNSDNYIDVYERDLIEANKEIVISCSDILYSKLKRFNDLVHSRVEAGVKITLIIESPDSSLSQDYEYIMEVIKDFQNDGIKIAFSNFSPEKYTIIDDNIVWHGSVNFLGKDDVWDNLIRIESTSIAAELKEITFANEEKINIIETAINKIEKQETE